MNRVEMVINPFFLQSHQLVVEDLVLLQHLQIIMEDLEVPVVVVEP